MHYLEIFTVWNDADKVSLLLDLNFLLEAFLRKLFIVGDTFCRKKFEKSFDS